MSISSQARWRQIRILLLDLMPFDVLDHHHLIDATYASDTAIAFRKQFQQQILKSEEPYAKEIDEAVEQWTKGKPLELQSERHKIHFFYRVCAAANFAGLHTMTSKGDEMTVLPEPQCSNETAAAFLLKEWWYEHGYRQYFDVILVEEWWKKFLEN